MSGKVKGCYVVVPSCGGKSGGSKKSHKSHKSHQGNKSSGGCYVS